MLKQKTFGSRIFDSLNILFMICMIIITIYPFLYVLFTSFSDPGKFVTHSGILLYPKGFSLVSYEKVLKNPLILLGYKNTIFYVVVGTAVNIFMTSLGAYALSRKNFYWKNAIMVMVVFTMFFGGGLIPNYLLVMKLGMLNKIWALIIPGAISTWNMIIMRTSFASIPDSLEESAKIDGAKDFTILFKIILPLSLPVIAVMVLFYGVAHWNAWFHAMIYLRNRKLYPLQLILRDILIANSTESMMTGIDSEDQAFISETIKHATIIVATFPILCVYPYLQKYFVKGIMIGSLKG